MNEQTQQHSSFYIMIWGVLIVFTLLSVGFGHFLHHLPVLPFAIFTIATLKAALVARYYMHLKNESVVIGIIALTSVVIVALILIGMVPDIVYQFGRMHS